VSAGRPPGEAPFDRYLRLLGVAATIPSRAALTELVAAHLARVPFENVSKLHYRKHAGLCGLPGLERFLDGIERYNFGGTCYTNNYYLHRLLAQLGYEVKLCGADMSNPDVHVVNLVALEGREWLVDVGYAAPFAEPLPCDLGRDHVIELGRERYLLKPRDAEGRSRMVQYRDGRLLHGYRINPKPRRIEEFARVIEDSFVDEATFMNTLLLVRFFPGSSIVIHNLTLIRSVGANAQQQEFSTREELADAIVEHFGMPRPIVTDAIADLRELRSAWT